MARTLRAASALVFTLAVAASWHHVQATSGLDVHDSVHLSQWQCLVKAGFEWTAINILNTTGDPNTFAPGNIRRAWTSGVSIVDAVYDPSWERFDPAMQLDSVLKYLLSNGVSHHAGPAQFRYGTLWVVVRNATKWTNSINQNVKFLEGLIDAAIAQNLTVGIQTSEEDWYAIMNGLDVASEYPLWYVSHDDETSFHDFDPFGGWAAANIKQYNAASSVCGTTINPDWYPDAEEEERPEY